MHDTQTVNGPIQCRTLFRQHLFPPHHVTGLRVCPSFSSPRLPFESLSGCIITLPSPFSCFFSLPSYLLVHTIPPFCLHSITMSHNIGTSTRSLHADDVLNVVSDVAPPLHLSTTFRYSDDPSALVPAANLNSVRIVQCSPSILSIPISLPASLHTLAIYIVNGIVNRLIIPLFFLSLLPCSPIPQPTSTLGHPVPTQPASRQSSHPS
jgi:hypothetical protein